jgi:hypothetical protein
MGKRIKSYKDFLAESKLNEGLVDWIKEKFKKVADGLSEFIIGMNKTVHINRIVPTEEYLCE